MPKIKKLRRKKKFRANVNRKRLRNRLRKLPNIECEQIKEAWEAKKSTVSNLTQMGLVYDPNKVLKIPNVKSQMLRVVESGKERDDSDAESIDSGIPTKLHVVQSLEEEAKWPRAKLFRLPNNEVQFATYMMDKYGSDYKAMVRDRKNYNQLTWRQIKSRIEKFQSIPEQYAEYLVNRGEIVLEDPSPLKKLKPDIMKEVTKKKITSKPSRRKRMKSNLEKSVWQEESIIDDQGISQNEVHPSAEEELSSGSAGDQKKLQLFSDDDDIDEDGSYHSDDSEDDNSEENKSDVSDSGDE